jgi:hypothetical protein
MVFESMQALAKNGVLVLASVTGGDQKIESAPPIASTSSSFLEIK